MKFAFSDEQEEFRSVLRRFLKERSPTTEVRRLMATAAGWERDQWRRVNAELGLAAIAVPEAYGGQGFGASEQCIVLEEMGRALFCAPYFSSTVLAASAILEAGTEAQKQRLLPGIASGETVATLAFAERGGGWDYGAAAATAIPDGSGYRISGTKAFVLDGTTADLIIVLARASGSQGEDGLSLFTLAVDTDGFEAAPLIGLDETRKLARLIFDGAPATLLGAEGAAGQRHGEDLDEGHCLPCQRNGRRCRKAARGRAGIHAHARAIRSIDCIVPGDETQGRGHAGGCRTG